jgi:hypothetical protein
LGASHSLTFGEKNMKHIYTVLICWLIFTISATAQSARHYLDLKEDDFSRDRFRLLDRSEVQRDLALTTSQIAALSKCWHAGKEEVPGLPEMTRKHHEELSQIDSNDHRRVEIIQRHNKEYFVILATHQSNSMAEILTSNQTVRLTQLLVQMRGPIIIIYDRDIQQTLQITPNQEENIKRSLNYYSPTFSEMIRRYGRQQVNGIVRDTREEREQELDALALATTALLKDRDGDILLNLSEEQRKKFSELEGKPLAIDWPKHDMVFGDIFTGEKNTEQPAPPRTRSPERRGEIMINSRAGIAPGEADVRLST